MMQQDVNCFCRSHLWGPPSSQVGSSCYAYATATVSASYITHPSHSHTWITGCACVWVRGEHSVHLDAIVHSCREIKQSPSLPLSLRGTLRSIWTVPVSSQHSRLHGEWCCRVLPVPQVLADVPPLPETEQHVWPVPLHLAPHPAAADQVRAPRTHIHIHILHLSAFTPQMFIIGSFCCNWGDNKKKQTSSIQTYYGNMT